MIGTYCDGSSGVTERIKILGCTRALCSDEEAVEVVFELVDVDAAPVDVAAEDSDKRLISAPI
jgi:hypothetical protein